MTKISNKLLLATTIVAMVYLFFVWIIWLFLNAAAQANEGSSQVINTLFFSHMGLVSLGIFLGWFSYLHKKSELMKLSLYAYLSSAVSFVFAPFVAFIIYLSYKSYRKELDHLARMQTYNAVEINRKK